MKRITDRIRLGMEAISATLNAACESGEGDLFVACRRDAEGDINRDEFVMIQSAVDYVREMIAKKLRKA